MDARQVVAFKIPDDEDYKNLFTPCLDCNEYGVALEAGTDADRYKCERCGMSYLIKVSDFKGNGQ